jgi:hypothetical protein
LKPIVYGSKKACYMLQKYDQTMQASSSSPSPRAPDSFHSRAAVAHATRGAAHLVLQWWATTVALTSNDASGKVSSEVVFGFWQWRALEGCLAVVVAPWWQRERANLTRSWSLAASGAGDRWGARWPVVNQTCGLCWINWIWLIVSQTINQRIQNVHSKR